MKFEEATVHPGEVLQHEFLTPRGLTVQSIAQKSGLQIPILMGVLGKVRPVNENTAKGLADALGTSIGFWLDLQADYDKEVT